MDEKITINTQGGPVITGGTFSNIEFVANKYVYAPGGACEMAKPIVVEEPTIVEEPLRNIIFNPRIFDSNKRLTALRNVIASAIDMGDATALYGEPQEMRINPQVKSEWYYIIKAIEEAHIAREFTTIECMEQMKQWFPSLFADIVPDKWNEYTRLLTKSVSAERGKWKEEKTGVEIPLSEMWPKERTLLFDRQKKDRIYAIAYQGLYTKLTALKQDIEKGKL